MSLIARALSCITAPKRSAYPFCACVRGAKSSRLMPCNRNQLRVFFRLSSLSDRMVFMSRLYFFFIRGIKSLRTRRFSASVPCVFMKYGKDLPEKLSCRYITRTYPEYASVRSVQSIWISVRGFFTSRSGGRREVWRRIFAWTQ